MLSSTLNSVQNISHFSHRINKITSTLLSTPIKGYSGACPFLRGLSTISDYTNASPAKEATTGETSAANNLLVESSYVHQESEKYQEQTGIFYHSQILANSELNNYNEQQIKDDTNKRVFEDEQQKQNNTAIETNNQRMEEIHNKTYNYDERLKELINIKKEDESYRVFKKIKRFSSNFPFGTEQDRPVTIWCSNDYFGMSSHPKIRQAIMRALDEYGAGSGGTRNIAGNSPVHEELEWELADLHEKESALLFSSCYVANDSTLFTLLRLIPDCHIFSDAGNHASMIQGIRNSGARKHIFKTFDSNDLEEKLKQLPKEVPKIVAFETVHSMTGDISDVEKMCDISHKYGAITFVDEVHAVGLYGDRGAGIGQREGCMDKIDIVSGTLGKAYGNCGGYVASTKYFIDVIRSYASGFIFTTSLPPTVACGATESVRILKGEEGRFLRELQQNNVFHMKRALTKAGLPHFPSKSHIIPIPIGESAKCTQVSNDLLRSGHYIQSINYPTVPKGTERLRVSVTPFHTEQMIDSLIEILVSVWNRNNLDFFPPVDIMYGQCRRHQILTGQSSKVAHSLWCQLCHKEMNLCTKTAAV